MLRFVLRKIVNKKWLMLALLTGNILLMSMASVGPVYEKAVKQRSLEIKLNDFIEAKNAYPMLMNIRGSQSSNQASFVRNCEDLLEKMSKESGLPFKYLVRLQRLETRKTQSNFERSERKNTVSISSLSDLRDHITIIEGKLPSSRIGEDGVIEAVVSEPAAKIMKFLVGEELEWDYYAMPDGSHVKVRITGVYTASDNGDVYWSCSSNYLSDTVLIDEDIFNEVFLGNESKFKNYAFFFWYAVFDYSDISCDDTGKIIKATENFREEIGQYRNYSMTENITGVLTDYESAESNISATIQVLSFSVYMLLLFFIFMVSGQILNVEEAEISVIRSRGASRGQIILIYLYQSLLITGIAFLVALPFSALIVRILGASSGFLEFVVRAPMKAKLSLRAVAFAGIGAAVSIIMMVVPVFSYSRVSIVNQKQKKHAKRSNRPLWQKLFLDVICMLVALYALYSFNSQKELLIQQMAVGKAVDPIIFLSASLFMLGAGLFVLRLLPLPAKFIFWLFRKKWKPAMYASFIQILRTVRKQGFIAAFLTITVALGVYNSFAARTINSNDERNIKYINGADIVLQEHWESNADLLKDNPSLKLEYKEPDFFKYEALEGVESATKVYRNSGVIVNAGTETIYSVDLMGIQTKSFGETAWFEDGLLDTHWYSYLNALASDPNAVLLSSDFKNYGLSIGSTIYYRMNNNTLSATVAGFVDYWPGYVTTEYSKNEKGEIISADVYLIIANLSPIQDKFGLLPYQVWIKNTEGSEYIYDFIKENKIRTDRFSDAESLIVKQRNNAVLQSTNGVLTMDFVIALLVCAVGFLIFWILSIKNRELQFGIFRAMGMSMGEITAMLINEQVFISLLSMAAGFGVGRLTAELYIPVIQIAYSGNGYVLPLKTVINAADYVRLIVLLGIMVVACAAVLIIRTRKMKIAQALKLGED